MGTREIGECSRADEADRRQQHAKDQSGGLIDRATRPDIEPARQCVYGAEEVVDLQRK
jgi:hypothetical protein